MAGLTGWHLLVLVLVVLLLFGAAKLPALAKSMGQSARLFKGEMKAMKDENGSSADAGDASVVSNADAAPVQSTAPVDSTVPKGTGTGSSSGS